MRKPTRLSAALAVAAFTLLPSGGRAAPADNHIFPMVVSAGAAHCLPRASGRVTITENPNTQTMHVEVFGLPRKTDFDFFVLQVPTAPFGLSWYQGDIHTDGNGVGVADFAGRFSIETFVVAPGAAAAPITVRDPNFPDADTNPPTRPVQTYHLGLWFDRATDAESAGCPAAKTPFNGRHDAGIQVLNTSNFPVLSGPLLHVQ